MLYLSTVLLTVNLDSYIAPNDLGKVKSDIYKCERENITSSVFTQLVKNNCILDFV